MAGLQGDGIAYFSIALMKPRAAPLRPPVVATSNEVSDEELMERFCQGGAQAFDVLFERYARAVHTYLTRLVASSVVAEDLTQATFLSVVRSRGRFQKAIRFRPWIYAIATNAARDWFRRGRREQLTEKGDLPVDGAEVDEPPRSDLALERAVRAAL